MKLGKRKLTIVSIGMVAALVAGCHDDDDDLFGLTFDEIVTIESTIQVFDGAALGCTTTVNGVATTEIGGGLYTFIGELVSGAVVQASGCTDQDTGILLPTLKGIGQGGGAVVSPITTLIVEVAIAGGADPANIPQATLDSVKAAIVANLGLGSYDPTDPDTANYVAAANDDTTGTSDATAVYRKVLALTTLLNSVVSNADNATDAAAAISALAQAFAQPSTSVDLTSEASITSLLERAADITPTISSVFEETEAFVSVITDIASSTGPIDEVFDTVTDANPTEENPTGGTGSTGSSGGSGGS